MPRDAQQPEAGCPGIRGGEMTPQGRDQSGEAGGRQAAPGWSVGGRWAATARHGTAEEGCDLSNIPAPPRKGRRRKTTPGLIISGRRCQGPRRTKCCCQSEQGN